MPDMLVKLYDLPDEAPALARSRAFGVEIRRAMPPDRERVLRWVGEHSGECAAGECAVAFAHTPCGCWIATRGAEIVGYACYDATAPDFFGPTRVLDSEQGHGVGTALPDRHAGARLRLRYHRQRRPGCILRKKLPRDGDSRF